MMALAQHYQKDYHGQRALRLITALPANNSALKYELAVV